MRSLDIESQQGRPRLRRSPRPVIVGALAGALAGVAAGHATAEATGSSGPPGFQAPNRAASPQGLPYAGVDTHGERGQIDVVPWFDLLESRAGKASGVFRVEVKNLLDTDVRVAHAWDLEDDLGNRLVEARGPDVGKLAARGLFLSNDWQLPWLHDGFYRLRVTVVSAGTQPEVGTMEVRDQWLEVTSGQLQEVTEEDWYDRSRGSLAEEMRP